MNIWNKVFLGVIFASAVAVVVLASVERKIRDTGQRHIDSLEQRIEKAGDDIARIVAGTPTESSFEELRGRLRERYYERGRAWFGCIVANLDEGILPPAMQQVIAQVIITGPRDESGNETDAVIPEHLRGIVYVFAEGGESEAGTFLGRFNVDSEPIQTPFRDSEGNQRTGYRVTLITADPVSDNEIEQIFDASRARWAIYMTPPLDRIAGIFDQLSEEEMQMIPEELKQRFQPRPVPELTEEEKDGVPSNVIAIWEKVRASIDDPEAEAALDFAAMLDWLYQRRSGLLRDIEVAESNIATFKVAEENEKAENEKLEADGILEEKRVEAMNVQRDAVKAQLEEYQAEVDRELLQVEELQRRNATLVAIITEYQVMAVETIEGQAATPVKTEEETE